MRMRGGTVGRGVCLLAQGPGRGGCLQAHAASGEGEGKEKEKETGTRKKRRKEELFLMIRSEYQTTTTQSIVHKNQRLF